MTTTTKTWTLLLLVACVIGYKGLLPQQTESTNGAVVKLSCVEFTTEADARRFKESGLVPAGSRVSNKPAAECPGTVIYSK